MSENVQTFSGKVNVADNLLVGTSHFFVDRQNNRVGIGTSTPDASSMLDVTGNIKSGGTITATGGFSGDGSGLSGVNSDSGSWVNGSSSNIHLAVSTDNVGIGVLDPSSKLDVDGDINIASGSTLKVGGTPAVFSNWSVDGSDIYRSSGRVGIGTTPSSKLHIYDTTTEPIIALQHLSGTENNSSTNVLGNLALHYSSRSGGYPSVGIRSIRRANTWDDQADMEFYVRNGGNGEQTAMVINSASTDNGARVGLGTSSPNKRLHVLHTDNSATGLLLENTDTGNEGRPHIEFKNNTGSAYIQFNGSGRSYPNQMGVLNNNGDITIAASKCVSYDNVYWYGRASTTTDGSGNFHGTGGQTQIQIVERSNGDIGLNGTSYVKINSKFAEGIYVVYCHVSIKTDGTRERGYSADLVKNGNTVFSSGRIFVDHYTSSTYNQIVLSGLINLSNGDYVSHQTTTNANFSVHKPDTRFYMYRISSL
jgi:hypothetical protein